MENIYIYLRRRRGTESNSRSWHKSLLSLCSSFLLALESAFLSTYLFPFLWKDEAKGCFSIFLDAMKQKTVTNAALQWPARERHCKLFHTVYNLHRTYIQKKRDNLNVFDSLPYRNAQGQKFRILVQIGTILGRPSERIFLGTTPSFTLANQNQMQATLFEQVRYKEAAQHHHNRQDGPQHQQVPVACTGSQYSVRISFCHAWCTFDFRSLEDDFQGNK